MVTPFSTSTCTPSGRFLRFLPSRMDAMITTIATISEDTVVCVMGMPPRMGMVK